MNTDEQGWKFIGCREAFVPVAYLDGIWKDGPLIGKQRFAIGFGSQTPPPKPGDTTTIEEAMAHLWENIKERDKSIAIWLKVPVSQNVWNAIASLNYQRGSNAARMVCSYYNVGHVHLAECEIGHWASGQDGIFTEGHAERRMKETDLARHGDYGDISKYRLYAGNPRINPEYVLTEFP